MIEIEGDFGSSITLQNRKTSENFARVREVRRKLENSTRLRADGAIVWEESGDIVPPSFIEGDARLEVPDSHREAFRRHEKDRPASQAEHRFEMRAAFGEGETVRNVITDQTYTT